MSRHTERFIPDQVLPEKEQLVIHSFPKMTVVELPSPDIALPEWQMSSPSERQELYRYYPATVYISTLDDLVTVELPQE